MWPNSSHIALGRESSFCHVAHDTRNVTWLRCPAFAGPEQLLLTLGANHLSNDCRGPGVSPLRGSTAAPYAENPATCMTWDRAINASAYRASTLAQHNGSDAAWASDAARRLRAWGFNTAGAWSSVALETTPGAPLFTVLLDMGASWTQTQARIFPDVFDDAWRARVTSVAAMECTPRRDAPNLLGYFADNELNWQGHWPVGHGCTRQHPGNCTSTSLLTWFLLEHDGAAVGAAVALAFVKERYADLAALNAAWGTHAQSWQVLGAAAPYPFPATAARVADEDAFLALAADRYHSITSTAIRAADPNHLIFGYRLNGARGDDPADDPEGELLLPLLRSASEWVDILDYHSYSRAAPLAELQLMHAHGGGLPVMVSEFAFRASDSGLPNTVGAGPLVPTQAARAAATEAYIQQLVALPFIVGYHSFAWSDEPAAGNGWGENSNYGLVHLDDDAYGEMTSMFTRLHASVVELHANANASSR